MKILVVGAGAVGGYFGGRLAEKGEDVTFLVRENRRSQLEQTGLCIQSVHGNTDLKPKTIVSGDDPVAYDAIILSVKAYHLESAMDSIAPYVGGETMILPLLNGMSHVDKLVGRFGEQRVIGGLCFVESTLDSQGRVVQSSPIHDVVFGERTGGKTERILKLQETLSGTKANFTLSESIVQDMWHKYLFITTLSGVTSLFRAPIGPIRENKTGLSFIKNTLSETSAIMRKLGAPIADDVEAKQLEKLNSMGFEMKSSLQRDMEKKLPIEVDHLYGFLLNEAKKYDIPAETLQFIYANLKIYER
ncbi:ketopantoate reductase family protein [Rossellomorea vietnamensis]|uniref:2-dehydropantoate 2-reductase n=1 Tax=Rossellomorea vietnamensis TaxID=218284 RepID=A0A5D4MEV4_9BACI|nr:ketopantoate reductase family protein [Rossellomorea vietnamensis]TYR99853.1 ketopantoate reductase family protein [Rossellomorea vietnamensis]